jgi:hypothetical protein
MGMERQPVVGMRFHVVKPLPRLESRVHVYRHSGDMGGLVPEIVTDFLGDAVSLRA